MATPALRRILCESQAPLRCSMFHNIPCSRPTVYPTTTSSGSGIRGGSWKELALANSLSFPGPQFPHLTSGLLVEICQIPSGPADL